MKTQSATYSETQQYETIEIPTWNLKTNNHENPPIYDRFTNFKNLFKNLQFLIVRTLLLSKGFYYTLLTKINANRLKNLTVKMDIAEREIENPSYTF